MTDQELLELAAKAVGVVFEWKATPLVLVAPADVERPWRYWNPLDDDGDAFRLMVALSLAIEFDGPTGMRVNYEDDRGRLCTVEQIVLEDLAAAVRRTIVRAAAELGTEK